MKSLVDLRIAGTDALIEEIERLRNVLADIQDSTGQCGGETRGNPFSCGKYYPGEPVCAYCIATDATT